MEGPGQYSGKYAGCAEMTAANPPRTKAKSMGLMEAVCERGNLFKAYERVVKNKGAAGVDGIAIPEFKAHLQKHWPAIKGHLMAGTYVPNAVRRVDIPKPQGGTRMLGIPTLTDRLIQQALHQVLSPLFEPTFSDSSYGFRLGKSAHQGHAFCRFADDSNIYVRSRRAGERVKQGITRFLTENLKLEVNEAKSAVDSPDKRKFLGYTFSWHQRPKLKVSITSLKRLMGNIRELMRKGRGGVLAQRSMTSIPCSGVGLPTSCGWKPGRHCQSSTSGFEGSFDASSGGNGKGLRPGTRI